MLQKFYIVLTVLGLLISSNSFANETHKLLFIDSYHPSFEWSIEVLQGIKETLEAESADVSLTVHYMDTKRHQTPQDIKNAVAEALELIETMQPDIVIACDDNAMKYLVMPYFRDAELPFVFCGVNWSGDAYELPYTNVTGILEVSLLNEIFNLIKPYANGQKIGYLAEDKLIYHNIISRHESIIGRQYNQAYLVKNFSEWKQAFLDSQEQVDILFLSSGAGLSDWNEEEATQFVAEHIKIPTVSDLFWVKNLAVITLAKVAQEHGGWSASTALRILSGTSPTEIPILINQQGKLYINLKLGNKLQIPFSPALLKTAEIIE